MKSVQWSAKQLLPPTALALLVASTAAIPLAYNRWFYYWDDSAAAFTPGWRVIGDKVLSGTFPSLIPELWAGGNVTAEALYGIYNPVLLANSALIASIPNMAIGITIVKMQFLAILAVGVYVLARQCGATIPMAFIAGYAMPFASYTLYFDASSWASGLFAFAWIPHVLWSARATAAGRINPIVTVVFAVLALTTGNPYGAVGVAVVYLAVMTECLVTRQRKHILRLFVSGSAALLLSLIVYLPLLFTTGVSVRTQSGVTNDGTLKPGLGDVLDLSNPTKLPMIDSFGLDFMTMPLGYLTWFVVPLIPWIRWRSLRASATASTSLLVFFGIYVLLLLGPSQLWLFRWPIRLLEYAQLPVIVAVAVAMSAGMYRNRLALRASLTAALLASQFYFAWSSVPEDIGYHGTALGVGAVLTALAVFLWRRNEAAFSGVLAAGVAMFLALQTLVWFPGNFNVTAWYFPRQAAFTTDRFDDRYVGTTFAVADTEFIPDDAPVSQWGDLVFGNQWQAAGVNAVNSYAGISYADFVDALCLTYYGGVPCDDAINRLMADAPGTDVAWMDALRLETIVVQNSGPYGGPRSLDDLPSSDWSVTTTPVVTVGRRITPLPWPDGHLSAASSDLVVEAQTTTSDTEETLRYRGAGTATFALLAWPGWSATVDGESVPVGATDGGLLQVDLPEGGSEAVIHYSPPGQSVGFASAIAGFAIALLHSVMVALRGRSRRAEDPTPTAQDAADVT